MKCPICGSDLFQEDRPNWYRCSNAQCICDDGNFSLYEKPRPLNWIKNRQMLEDERDRV